MRRFAVLVFAVLALGCSADRPEDRTVALKVRIETLEARMEVLEAEAAVLRDTILALDGDHDVLADIILGSERLNRGYDDLRIGGELDRILGRSAEYEARIRATLEPGYYLAPRN